MSDQDTKSYQVNIRLNEVASRQLADLNNKLNLDRSALIRMAIASLHREQFPPHHPPPPATGTPPPPTGKG